MNVRLSDTRPDGPDALTAVIRLHHPGIGKSPERAQQAVQLIEMVSRLFESDTDLGESITDFLRQGALLLGLELFHKHVRDDSIKPFPDSLSLSQEHFIFTKPRAKNPVDPLASFKPKIEDLEIGPG